MNQASSHFLALLLGAAGVYSIGNGLMIEREAAGAIHQVYGAVYITGGGVIVGLAAVVEAVTGIGSRKKPKRSTVEKS